METARYGFPGKNYGQKLSRKSRGNNACIGKATTQHEVTKPTLLPHTPRRAPVTSHPRARTSHERTSSHSHARQRPLTRTVARHSTRVTIGFQPTGEQTRAMPFSPILGANRANTPRECARDETPAIKRRVARPRRRCLGAWGAGIERCRRTMTRRADD